MSKESISGKKISRKEAYKGLGNPETWKEFSDRLYEEFRLAREFEIWKRSKKSQ